MAAQILTWLAANGRPMDPPSSRACWPRNTTDGLLLLGLLVFLTGSCLVTYDLWATLAAERALPAATRVTSDDIAGLVFLGESVTPTAVASGSQALASSREPHAAGASRAGADAGPGPDHGQAKPGGSIPPILKPSVKVIAPDTVDRRDWLLVTSRNLRPPPRVHAADRYQMAGQSARPGYVDNVYIGHIAGE